MLTNVIKIFRSKGVVVTDFKIQSGQKGRRQLCNGVRSKEHVDERSEAIP